MTPEQFVAIYREHLPAISRYLGRRVDRDQVEDLAAMVFEVAWQKRESVTVGQELPWLYKIASFQVSNFRRRQSSALNFLTLTLSPDNAPSAESLAVFDADLAAGWAKLSPSDRALLALVAFDGLGVGQAAAALSISANAASAKLHRARAKLAKYLAVKD
ncbi:RNA polymerase sigma factor [Rhodoluna limnophila]|uniref:RNA polymerase sigma factor n=1 Tax=Rhodoluna limnophila TaxID=232537 RepID=UPI0011072624|nr:sigma-70 family RNA polymerase sigma factor [Rhodoluna limnophila]